MITATRNKKILDYMEKDLERIEKMTKEEARDYLISIGIYNKDGTLTKNYGGKE